MDSWADLFVFLCFSGSRSGSIHQHDVRIADHLVATLSGHSQEVCGLSWSPDGRYLASGGNDNVLNVWQNHLSDDLSPLFRLTHHQAAVKVLLNFVHFPISPTPLEVLSIAPDKVFFFNPKILIVSFITKTCLYNIDPLKPHFYTVKLGFTGVYIYFFFFFLLKNIDCGYLLELPEAKQIYQVPTIYVLSRSMKNRVFT